MSKITAQIREWLNDDMVSHGLLLQALRDEQLPESEWIAVLRDLLPEDVEIGETNAIPNYVEFIAWKGTTDERIARAERIVHSLTWPDREFSYWLALRKNVDRFEDEKTKSEI